MEERLGGGRSACFGPACLSAAGHDTHTGFSELIGYNGCHDNHIYHVARHKWNEYEGGGGRWEALHGRADKKSTMNWKQQRVITRVVKCVNEHFARARRWMKDKWKKLPLLPKLIFAAQCFSQNPFKRDGRLDTARARPPLEAQTWQRKERSSSLLSSLLQFGENTPLMKWNVWRAQAPSLEKDCLWLHHTEKAQYGTSAPAAFSPLIALIDLYKELSTSAGN